YRRGVTTAAVPSDEAAAGPVRDYAAPLPPGRNPATPPTAQTGTLDLRDRRPRAELDRTGEPEPADLGREVLVDVPHGSVREEVRIHGAACTPSLSIRPCGVVDPVSPA